MAAALAVTAAAGGALATAAPRTGPGSHSQAAVNRAIDRGATYLAKQQNKDGSIGTTFVIAETGLAVGAFGVRDGGRFAVLPTGQRRVVGRAIRYLLSQQTSTGQFGTDNLTYQTGIALTGLALSGPVPGLQGRIRSSIRRGRRFLLLNQQAPRSVTHNPKSLACQSTGREGTGRGGQSYCGGWNYDTDVGRSDESNTGFALTGLFLTGGVPPRAAKINIGWQRNVQEYPRSPFATRRDGGGVYQPGDNDGDFSSNANDTGSLIFGYAYDRVPASDPGAAAAIRFGRDVVREYERVKRQTPRTMIFHTGKSRDGTCTIGRTACDWSFAAGEGGYHYSLFALSKGLGRYDPASLGDRNNFYAQIADLLLTDQTRNGSWPADLRDDASDVAATSFAVLALGKVGTGSRTAPPGRPRFTG